MKIKDRKYTMEISSKPVRATGIYARGIEDHPFYERREAPCEVFVEQGDMYVDQSLEGWKLVAIRFEDN